MIRQWVRPMRKSIDRGLHPAALVNSAIFSIVKGANSLGLSTTEFPAARAGACIAEIKESVARSYDQGRDKKRTKLLARDQRWMIE